MEKLPKIEQQINNQDNSRRFENLEEELMDYQFQYIEKIDSGILKPIGQDEKKDFAEMLDKYTTICNDLSREFYKRAEKIDYDKFGYDQGYFAGSTAGKIFELYKRDKNHWRDGVKKIFNDSVESLGEVKRDTRKNEDKKAGLIHFNLHKIDELSEFGFDKNDDFISIHFEKLYEQKNNNTSVKNIFSGDSLSKLASLIIKEYPQVKAITAKSWLLDSPIGKRIGFDITKRYEGVTSNEGFWGQFITENGELNKEKMQKFLSSGQAEFYPAKGYIKIEDFLRKYLPKEERGIVKLRDITEDSKIFREDVAFVSKELKEKWNSLSYEEIFNLVCKNKILAEFFTTEDGKKFLDIIRIAKESNLGQMDFDQVDYPDKHLVKQKFNNFVNEKSNQYKEKEVLIP